MNKYIPFDLSPKRSQSPKKIKNKYSKKEINRNSLTSNWNFDKYAKSNSKPNNNS